MSANEYNWGAFEEAYQQVDGAGGGSFTVLPTGKYQAMVKQNMFDVSKMVFERKFQIISGPHTGKIQTDWIYLFKKDGNPNEIAADRLKSEIRLMDGDLADMPLKDTWKAFCEASLDQIVNIYVSTKPRVDRHTKEPICDENGVQYVDSTIYINEFVNIGADPTAEPQTTAPF